MPSPAHFHPRLAAALLLAGCASGPTFVEQIHAAASHLDSGRNEDAVAFLDLALDATAAPGQRHLALAMLVEVHLGAGDEEHAGRALGRLRQEAPSAFVTWKAQAVLDLRLRGTSAARRALQAAQGAQERDGQGTWLRDFGALLDALDAFADGDFEAARRQLAGIGHADVTPAAAYVRGRLDAIQRVNDTRISMARRAGARAGVGDLWRAAAAQPAVQRQVADYARQIGQALEPSNPENPAGVAHPRGRLPAMTLGLAGAAAWARLAAGQTPIRLRHD